MRSYITLLLTVQLWPALSSVVNYLVIAHDLHPFTLLAQNFGGSSLQAAHDDSGDGSKLSGDCWRFVVCPCPVFPTLWCEPEIWLWGSWWAA